MAAENRGKAHDLESIWDLLLTSGRRRFRAIVAFLERMVPHKARIGDYGPVEDEPVRFRHDPELTFSRGDISEIALAEVDSQEWPPAATPAFGIMTSFLGLTGAVSPLPSYFAHEIAQDTEPHVRDFLDVFHHRLVSLFYRATCRYNPVTEFESDAHDLWSKRVMTIGGIDTYPEGSTTPVPRWLALRLAPLLARPTCSCWTLETALSDVLEDEVAGAKVEIEQFVGSWVPIDLDQQIHLGLDNSDLGYNTVLGERAWDTSGKFRIHIGPLTKESYNRLQHNPEIRQLVKSTVGLLCRDPLEYDLALELGGGAVSGLSLAAESTQRLGIDTFLGTPSEDERMEVVIPLSDVDAARAA